ncbi:MAG: BACON domain-containing protein [Bacteroidales bacterium]|nr:BACON domain-containing protein [Bacteroidales bacterium]
MKKYLYLIPVMAGLICLNSCTMGLFGDTPGQFSAEQETYSFSAAVQDVTVKFNCDKMWSASLSDGSWAKVIKETIEEDNVSAGVVVRVAFNGSSSERKDKLVVTSGSKTLEVELVQKPVGSFISATTISLDKGPQTVTLQSVSAWKIVANDAPWLVIEPSSGLVGRYTISFAAKDGGKEVYEPRSATVNLVYDNATMPLTVTESAIDAIILPEDESMVDNTIRLGNVEGSFSITVDANVDYSVSVSKDWLKYRDRTTKAMEESVLSFDYSSNTLQEDREAVIKIAAKDNPDLVQEITVVQSGYDPAIEIKVPGLYGASDSDTFIYDETRHQTSRHYMDTYLTFRIMDPAEGTVLQVAGYSSDMREGETASLAILSDLSMAPLRKVATLLAAKDGLAWFKSSDDTVIIIKI